MFPNWLYIFMHITVSIATAQWMCMFLAWQGYVSVFCFSFLFCSNMFPISGLRRTRPFERTYWFKVLASAITTSPGNFANSRSHCPEATSMVFGNFCLRNARDSFVQSADDALSNDCIRECKCKLISMHKTHAQCPCVSKYHAIGPLACGFQWILWKRELLCWTHTSGQKFISTPEQLSMLEVETRI